MKRVNSVAKDIVHTVTTRDVNHADTMRYDVVNIIRLLVDVAKLVVWAPLTLEIGRLNPFYQHFKGCI